MMNIKELMERDRQRSGVETLQDHPVVVDLSDKQLCHLDLVCEMLCINLEACLNACVRLGVANYRDGNLLESAPGADHSIQFNLTMETLIASNDIPMDCAELSVRGLAHMVQDILDIEQEQE